MINRRRFIMSIISFLPFTNSKINKSENDIKVTHSWVLKYNNEIIAYDVTIFINKKDIIEYIKDNDIFEYKNMKITFCTNEYKLVNDTIRKLEAIDVTKKIILENFLGKLCMYRNKIYWIYKNE